MRKACVMVVHIDIYIYGRTQNKSQVKIKPFTCDAELEFFSQKFDCKSVKFHLSSHIIIVHV